MKEKRRGRLSRGKKTEKKRRPKAPRREGGKSGGGCETYSSRKGKKGRGEEGVAESARQRREFGGNKSSSRV